MTRIVAGILAHVDAGKTTLVEGLMHESGQLRTLGRVDHGDAFLDTDAMEKQRGITIFSKQAQLNYHDLQLTLLDTPGHIDFSSEMERTLSVLDYAILVISASDGVEGQAERLWHLLSSRNIPTFIFINKMDADGADKQAIMQELRRRLSENCIDCSGVSRLATDKVVQEITHGSAIDELGNPSALSSSVNDSESATLPEFQEDVAMLGDEATQEFLDNGAISTSTIRSLITHRAMIPVFFGSALKLQGIDTLLNGLRRYAEEPAYPQEFGAQVFNISHDPRGERLTWIKVTGGTLQVKSPLDPANNPTEKSNQLRVYSGAKFELANELPAGSICAATGLTSTRAGNGYGIQMNAPAPTMEPVLEYTLLPGEVDVHKALQALRILEDEDPLLHIRWDEHVGEVRVRLMGEVHLEVIRQMMLDRFGYAVDFGPGSILYKETIEKPVIGVGHFEPLRHYAEVHILMEPAEEGSGLSFAADCDDNILAPNWQRLVLTHLKEREHLGVLTGSPITDMRLTVISGRSHPRHTEGGDFREATYRAVRQGLMKAQSVLLEPWYEFHAEVPQEFIGRVMADVQRMSGQCEAPSVDGEFAMVSGTAPVEQMRDYAITVHAFTHGRGRFDCRVAGYKPCHNAEEIIEQAHYDPEGDANHTPDSVFCAHGAGYAVAWNRVEDFMHVQDER